LGLNAAVAYLVLARFTAHDQVTTKAGVQAIEVRTGISRARARQAIEKLEDAGLVSKANAQLTRRITSARALPKAVLAPELEFALCRCEARLPLSDADIQRLEDARSAGAVIRNGDTYIAAPKVTETPDCIWLPNTLIDGAAGEASPVEFVRQATDPLLLRLLVDMYHAHNLASDGGVHWQAIRQSYRRTEMGDWRSYKVWGFEPESVTYFPASRLVSNQLRGVDHQEGGMGTALYRQSLDEFLHRFEALARMGLFEIVPHLVEADTEEAEVIYPYGLETGEEPEKMLAAAIQNTAHAMVWDARFKRARGGPSALGLQYLALAPQHMPNVQMVGVVRLRYRPHTGGTSGWWATMNEKCQTREDELKRLDAVLTSTRCATSR
jgi:hypothetical protein